MSSEHQKKVLLLAVKNAKTENMLNILAGQEYAPVLCSTVDELISRLSGDIALLVIARNLDSGDRRRVISSVHSAETAQEWPILLVLDDPHISEWMEGYDGLLDGARLPLHRELFLSKAAMLISLASKNAELARLKVELQKLEQAECIRTISGSMVHEFNNLMFALGGFAESALSDPTNVEGLKECADVAQQIAKRASSVASNLLAMSKHVPTTETVGSLNDAIHGALKLLSTYLKKQNVQIRLNLNEIPPTRFAFGPFQQVLINLFFNAAQAMETQPGERILTVSSRIGDGRLEVLVQDNGCGIPEEIMPRIFEPFFTTKAKQSEEAGVGGSGLGLSIVREVVKKHGGVICVDSKEGEGATFTILLPLTSEAERAIPSPEGKDVSIAQHAFSVLVVDDDEASRRTIMKMLLRYGYDMYTAASVPEAMSLFWSGKIDLIVLDLVMPQVDGLKCVTMLREDDIQIPILLCTGFSDSPLIQQALDAGAQGVLMKPFSSQQLLQAVQKCLATPANENAGKTP